VNAIESSNKTRRLIVRGVLVVAYLSLMMVAFIFGKGHTILLDNKDSTDGTVKAFESMTVSVDGQEPIEFMSGDRDLAKVRAQWHTIKIDLNGQIIEKKFTVPLGMDVALLSIPKLVAGIEPAMIPFVAADEPAAPADPDAGKSNEFTSPGGTPEVPLVPVVPAPAAP
jgi:hypothetical protein